MTDWNGLHHAYGPATEIPKLLEQLRSNPSEDLWQEIWSCLCHQGTVYSASFAALEPLFEIAKFYPPGRREPALTLIGAIISSSDLHGIDVRPDELISRLLPTLSNLATEEMEASGPDSESFIYCLQAASVFAGDLFWGRYLYHLADGEFGGTCPNCGHDLYFVFEGTDVFVTAHEYVGPNKVDSQLNEVLPAHPAQLTNRAAWLYATARNHDQFTVADQITYIFGETSCPECSKTLDVSGAIRNSPFYPS